MTQPEIRREIISDPLLIAASEEAKVHPSVPVPPEERWIRDRAHVRNITDRMLADRAEIAQAFVEEGGRDNVSDGLRLVNTGMREQLASRTPATRRQRWAVGIVSVGAGIAIGAFGAPRFFENVAESAPLAAQDELAEQTLAGVNGAISLLKNAETDISLLDRGLRRLGEKAEEQKPRVEAWHNEAHAAYEDNQQDVLLYGLMTFLAPALGAGSAALFGLRGYDPRMTGDLVRGRWHAYQGYRRAGLGWNVGPVHTGIRARRQLVRDYNRRRTGDVHRRT